MKGTSMSKKNPYIARAPTEKHRERMKIAGFHLYEMYLLSLIWNCRASYSRIVRVGFFNFASGYWAKLAYYFRIATFVEW